MTNAQHTAILRNMMQMQEIAKDLISATHIIEIKNFHNGKNCNTHERTNTFS